MEKKTSSRFTYTKLHHVGVVVRDIDKAIAYLESIGIGPFEAWDGQKVGSVKFNGKLHGKSATWTTKVSNANLPEVQLELLEPSEGNQALKESLDKNWRRAASYRVYYRRSGQRDLSIGKSRLKKFGPKPERVRGLDLFTLSRLP
jgi:hypothetical protein